MSEPTVEQRIAFAKDALVVFQRMRAELVALEDRHPGVHGFSFADAYDELIEELERTAQQ